MPSLFQKFQKLCFESIFISLWVNSEPPLRYLHPGLGACPEIHKRQFDFSQKVEKLFGFWLCIVSPNVTIGVHYHYAPRPQLSFFMKPRNDHWFATIESLKVWSLHSNVLIFSWQRKQLDSCHICSCRLRIFFLFRKNLWRSILRSSRTVLFIFFTELASVAIFIVKSVYSRQILTRRFAVWLVMNFTNC